MRHDAAAGGESRYNLRRFVDVWDRRTSGRALDGDQPLPDPDASPAALARRAGGYWLRGHRREWRPGCRARRRVWQSLRLRRSTRGDLHAPALRRFPKVPPGERRLHGRGDRPPLRRGRRIPPRGGRARAARAWNRISGALALSTARGRAGAAGQLQPDRRSLSVRAGCPRADGSEPAPDGLRRTERSREAAQRGGRVTRDVRRVRRRPSPSAARAPGLRMSHLMALYPLALTPQPPLPGEGEGLRGEGREQRPTLVDKLATGGLLAASR